MFTHGDGRFKSRRIQWGLRFRRALFRGSFVCAQSQQRSNTDVCDASTPSALLDFTFVCRTQRVLDSQDGRPREASPPFYHHGALFRVRPTPALATAFPACYFAELLATDAWAALEPVATFHEIEIITLDLTEMFHDGMFMYPTSLSIDYTIYTMQDR